MTAAIMSYRVQVNYRTASGGNSRTINVDATSWDEAISLAMTSVRLMRGVVKIDGGASVGNPIPASRP